MLKALWRAWLVIAKKIGYVQSQLVMTIVYFVFLAPFAAGVRLFSDPLGLRRTTSWYWSESRSAPTLESVSRQF